MFESLGELIAVLTQIIIFVLAVILIISMGEFISWLLGFLGLNVSGAIVLAFAVVIFVYEKIR